MLDTVPIKMPAQEGTKSVIERWLKREKDYVKIHDPLVEIVTDKVTIEVSSPATGQLQKIIKKENESVEPEEIIGEILIVEKVLAETLKIESEKLLSSSIKIDSELIEPGKKETPTERLVGQKLLLSPAVRKLIRKYELDVQEIKGSGKNGRVTYKDVENLILQNKPRTTIRIKPVLEKERRMRRSHSKIIRHSPMRKQIADHMVMSMLKTAPHVTAIFEMDMSNIVAHRKKHMSVFYKQGIKLTFTSYFAMASVLAMQQVPEVNSRWYDDKLELFGNCNIGIATAVENGLVVPVVQESQNYSLIGMATELQLLTNRARNGNLSQKDVKGGTFTITNHGVSGSLIATPIINQPQSAILGIGKMQKRVIVKEVNGEDCILIKPMIYVTLTIDHRALDGFRANQFLTTFVDVIENWK